MNDDGCCALGCGRVYPIAMAARQSSTTSRQRSPIEACRPAAVSTAAAPLARLHVARGQHGPAASVSDESAGQAPQRRSLTSRGGQAPTSGLSVARSGSCAEGPFGSFILLPSSIADHTATNTSRRAYVVMAYVAMAYVGMPYIVMAYVVMALYSYGLHSYGLYIHGPI